MHRLGGEGGGDLGRQDLQLEAVGAVGVAGDAHGSLAGAGLEVEVQLLVVRGPVDKVDQVHAEGAGVGVDARPGQVEGRALGEGRVGGRVGELDGGGEVRAEGEGGKKTHFVVFFFI